MDHEEEIEKRLNKSPYKPLLIFGIVLLEEEFFNEKPRNQTRPDFLKWAEASFDDLFIGERCKGVYYISVLQPKKIFSTVDIEVQWSYTYWRRALKELGIPYVTPEITII